MRARTDRHCRALHARGAQPVRADARRLALREALSTKIERLYGRRYDPVTEITVTTGATEGLFVALTALVHPGDEVLMFQPAYDSYPPAVILSGGKPVYVTLRYPDYRIDWDEVRRL